MANDETPHRIPFRKPVTWIAGIGFVFAMAACLQIADIEPPILDTAGSGGASSSSTSSSSSISSGLGVGGGTCAQGPFVPCAYTGPAGTEGVGDCKAGTKVCFDGNYLPCGGEVVPRAEDCATVEDEDCDGTSGVADSDCGLPSDWVYTYGTAMPIDPDDSIFALAPTSDGGYVMGGVINGAKGMDDFAVSKGTGYLAHVSSNGTKDWEELFTTTIPAMNYAVVRSVAVDTTNAVDDVVAVGSYTGTMTVGGSSFPSMSPDAFIVKRNNDGAVAWTKTINAPGIQLISSVVVDSLGHIFITGTTGGAVDFGGGMSASPTANDVFIASYDKNGAYRWHKLFVNPGNQGARALAIIPKMSPELVVVGFTDAAKGVNVNLGGNALPSGGGQDIFIARYLLADGAHVASQLFGDGADQDARAVAVDSTGDILVAGDFFGDIDWGDGSPISSPDSSPVAFAAKLGSDGTVKMSVAPALMGKSSVSAIGSDSLGNIVVAGQFDGELNWNGMVFKSTMGFDSFVVKITAKDWSPIHGSSIGQAGDQLAWAFAPQANGSIAIGGAFRGSLSAPPLANKTPVGNLDLFVLQVKP